MLAFVRNIVYNVKWSFIRRGVPMEKRRVAVQIEGRNYVDITTEEKSYVLGVAGEVTDSIRHAAQSGRNAGRYDHLCPPAGLRVDQRNEADAQLHRLRTSAKRLGRQSAGEGCSDPERTHPDSSHHAGTHCAGFDRNAECKCDHGCFCQDSGVGSRADHHG